VLNKTIEALQKKKIPLKHLLGNNIAEKEKYNLLENNVETLKLENKQ